MRLSRWARASLTIGAIMLAIGVIPLWLTSTFLPGGAPTLFIIAFYLVAPLGAVFFALGALLWLYSWIAK